MREDEPVTLGELAREFGITKSATRRYAQKRGFSQYVLVRRDATHQAAQALVVQDADRLREIRRAEGFTSPKPQDRWSQ